MLALGIVPLAPCRSQFDDCFLQHQHVEGPPSYGSCLQSSELMSRPGTSLVTT